MKPSPKKIGLIDHLLAVIYALDGQIYAAADGARLEVVNIRLVRNVLRATFALAVVAAGALWLTHHRLLVLAVLPVAATLVVATLLLLPWIKVSNA